MDDTDRREQIERLWASVRRDFFATVEEFAGFRELDDQRWQRFQRNWTRLCELDLDIAARLSHGLDEIHRVTARHDDPAGPAAQHLRGLNEGFGLAKIGREANPTAEVETMGELAELGLEEIRRQVDEGTEA